MAAQKHSDLLEELRKIFVSIDIFNLTNKGISDRINPLEKLVYGMISVILLGFLSAVVGLVIMNVKT